MFNLAPRDVAQTAPAEQWGTNCVEEECEASTAF